MLIRCCCSVLYIYAEIWFELLFSVSGAEGDALRGLNLIDRFPAGPFSVSMNNVSGILSTFSLAIIILLRSTKMSQRQAQLESEMAAAQEVQQLLVPERPRARQVFMWRALISRRRKWVEISFRFCRRGMGDCWPVVGDVAGTDCRRRCWCQFWWERFER